MSYPIKEGHGFLLITRLTQFVELGQQLVER